jgi:hypothetical protein
VSVADLAGAAVDASLAGSEDAFALTFAGPVAPALPAGTHTLAHPALGTFELFVAPVAQPREQQLYEAVIDRSVGAPRTPPRRPAPPATATAPVATDAPRAARLLRRVRLRRTARGARAVIVLGGAVEARRVEGRLMRRGRTVAMASRRVRDREAVLRFRRARRLRAGRYTLLVTVVGATGRTTSRRRRVTLR